MNTQPSIIPHLLLLLLLTVGSSYAQQGGDTCSDAKANSNPLPFAYTAVSVCDNNATNAYPNNPAPCSSGANTRPDWLFHLKPTQSGTLIIDIANFQQTGGGGVQAHTRVYIMEGCPSSGATCVDDFTIKAFNNEKNSKRYSFEAEKNKEYYLLMEKANDNSYSACITFDLSVGLLTPLPTSSTCANIDFEAGSFQHWQQLYGTSVGGVAGDETPEFNASGEGSNPNATQGNGHLVHNKANGENDKYGQADLPKAYPNGGQYSIQLGNDLVNAGSDRIAQKFNVTASNASFTYHYAVVLEDPFHPSHEQPFFKAQLKDQNGQAIQCSKFVVAASSGLTQLGFKTSPLLSPDNKQVYYKPWSTVNVDLTNYIGQAVTVEFTAGDCSEMAHFGYAYVEASCGPSLLAENTNKTICQGNNTTLKAPDGYQSYLWKPGNHTGKEYTVSPSVTTTYQLELTAYNDCKSTNQAKVTVNNCSNCSLALTGGTPTNASCGQNNGRVNGVAITGNAGSETYAWTNAAGTTVGTSLNLTGVAAGTYTLTVKEGTCSATVGPFTVGGGASPTLNAGADATICAGDNTSLQATPTGGTPVSYSWTPTTGLSDATVANPVASPTTTTTYTVVADFGAGCTATDKTTITVDNCPAPCTLSLDDIESTQVSCQSNPDGTATATVSGGNGTYAYHWKDHTGLEVSTSATATGLTAGLYTLTITDGQGCQATGTVSVQQQSCSFCVLSAQATLETNTACANRATITASGGSGTYVFSSAVGTLSTNSSTATLTDLPVGTHTVAVADATDNTCTTTTTVTVPATTALALSTTSTASACEEPTGKASVAVSGGQAPYQYAWSSTGGAQAQATNLAGGVYTITVTDAAGCSASDTVHVMPIGATSPALDLGADTVLCEGNFLILDATFPGASYQWGDQSTQATYLVSEAGTYTLTISNACGSTTASINVKTIACQEPAPSGKVRMANALTPNGDGQNDTFFVEGIEAYSSNELFIYNRWGSLVYQTTGYHNQWGGTYQGKPLPTGAYYYVLYLHDKAHTTYSGTVSVFE